MHINRLDATVGDMDKQEPVFGPDRPAAAIRAINAFLQARAALDETHVWDSRWESRNARYQYARDARVQYSEYGDSFRGH